VIGPSGHARRKWVWWSIAAIALTVGVVSFLATLPKSDPKVVVLAQTPTQTTSTAPAKVSHEISAIARSRPVTLTIPSIGVSSKVGSLGLQPNHQVMVPAGTHTVGWYKYGATPGQIGSAVILGHVDSYLGPGEFFDLKLLKPGARVNLVLANGTVTNFAVTKVVQYSKTSFPDQLVYGSHGTRSLQLVTCGGTFDSATGHYESNIVVFSQLVSASSPKAVVRS
jgi:sortase (surface protein transpeptidase)